MLKWSHEFETCTYFSESEFYSTFPPFDLPYKYFLPLFRFVMSTNPTYCMYIVFEPHISPPETVKKNIFSQLQPLPDMKVSGIVLSEGKLAGLSNLSRWGHADIDIK